MESFCRNTLQKFKLAPATVRICIADTAGIDWNFISERLGANISISDHYVFSKDAAMDLLHWGTFLQPNDGVSP
jgi:hypothetical protein